MTSPAIEVRGLVKRFGRETAVKGIDLVVERGTCVGLLGPNGAGKTTTVEILEGLQEPTEGTVRVLGMSWDKDRDALRRRIGLALQETHFSGRLTVEETLRLFRSFFPTGMEIDAALACVKLQDRRRARVAHLSGGQRQRLALAIAVIGGPEILFLDEPSTGLDPNSRRAVWDIVLELRRQGTSILLTTHYMDEAERLCDSVVVVDAGLVVESGSPQALIASLGGPNVIECVTTPALPNSLFAGMGLCARPMEEAGGHRIWVHELDRSMSQVLAAVAQAGAQVTQISTRRSTLEDVFVTLTGRNLSENR